MATKVQMNEYKSRILAGLKQANGPVTCRQLRNMPGVSGPHDRIVSALESLESDGVIVRGTVVKIGHSFTTWTIAPDPKPQPNGHTNGHARFTIPLGKDSALTYFDARKIVEDLYLGIESIRVLAEQLEIALLDWPNLSLRELVERHCHATGKDTRGFVYQELLPLAIEMGKETRSS
jgi:hypothetical protein